MNSKENESTQVTLGTTYELNKIIMKDQGLMTAEQWHEIAPKLEDWFNWEIDTYAMLLCHERRDYTIFALYKSPAQNPNPPEVAVDELQVCLSNRGDVQSIEKTEDGIAWEIWVKDGDESFVYYLFPYDDAVIEC